MKKLSMKEYERLKTDARTWFVSTVMGERPTYQSIAQNAHNPFKINALQWWGILLLVVLALFTSLKQFVVAVPFAQSLFADLSGYTTVSDGVLTLGIMVTQALFMLIGTPGLIYFKLLAVSDDIQDKKAATQLHITKWYHVFRILSLEYITPRIPAIVVYGILAWLFVVSWHGVGIPEATIFERMLPVVIELGLAYLVGELIRQRAEFRKQIHTELEAQLKPYDDMLETYEYNPKYLEQLYRLMSEYIPRMRGDNNRDRPNSELRNNDRALHAWVLREYNRLNSGRAFAESVLSGAIDVDNTIDALDTVQDRRKPPRNESAWTAATLSQDFRIRGLSPDMSYSRKDLDREYESGYGARNAFKHSEYFKD